ncbi:hypothetical protein QYE76_067688 [Lolium multiflorum]|uniref:CCHC-type domain-containing protein n=1 Tax=Lolium multiflorum TaxID=4521 RepID=A0AAD8SDZ5_LOLMU|nr:hypothetical protein QYE76_067688 [Lolium multiflorum]
MMTWEDFKLKFSKYHVPPGLIKKMRDEFRELKQGRMTVVEYRDKFLTLSRYAPDETDTVEKRKERPGGHNNYNNNNHNNNFNRAPPRTPNNNSNTAPRTGSNAVPITPKDKSTYNCYECGVAGHFSYECPKKLAKPPTPRALRSSSVVSPPTRSSPPTTRTTATAASTT